MTCLKGRTYPIPLILFCTFCGPFRLGSRTFLHRTINFLRYGTRQENYQPDRY
jgi:hypothetical protein